MAEMSTLPPDVRQFVSTYPWRHIEDPIPWAAPKVPTSEMRVGLVVMACEKLPEQSHFTGMETGGDPTPRILPSDLRVTELVNDFPAQAYDHSGLEADPNVLVPLDRMRELASAGVIGEFSPRVVSLCGHITKPDRLIDETAPEIAHLFAQDGADAVLLVPA